MIEKNGTMLIVISIMIILFTEIIGINMQITLNYLPIFFAIVIVILFNLMLKKETTNKKNIIIFNIIVLGTNFVLTKLIGGTFGYSSILAVLILCKFLYKINFIQFDKLFFKNIVKYYILPLVVLLIIDMGYTKLAYAISELYEFWMVNYVYFAMVVIYNVLIANIMMIMLVLLFRELINSKIPINVSSKSIFIISSIILIIILCIKVVVGCVNLNEADNKIETLNNTIQSNSLNTYYELNFDSDLKVEDGDEIQDKEQRYMMSFNDILIKGVSSWSELFYKTETNGIEDLVNRRRMTKKEALQAYTESAEKYVERLNIYKENLSMQNASNVIIYLLDVICIFIVYKKSIM